MSDTLIEVKGLSKKYCLDFKKSLLYGVSDIARDLIPNSRASEDLRPKEFWALKDINFTLNRGECLSLVGGNGAGKTTLLKILNGLVKPDRGTVRLKGRTGALIALGAGFNPVLTGRENILVNASLLGMSKRKTLDKFDEIVDFAEIEKSIDSPVQTYSSGMQVRLGFAVAAVLMKPDILFLDEVLAVGDVAFQVKSLNAIREMRNNAAVIFVSHNLHQVSNISTEAMLLHEGQVTKHSNQVGSVLNSYLETMAQSKQIISTENFRFHYIEATDLEKTFTLGNEVLRQNSPINIKLGFDTDEPTVLNFYVLDSARESIINLPVQISSEDEIFLPGNHDIGLVIPPLNLTQGIYSLLFVAKSASNNKILHRDEGFASFSVTSNSARWGKIVSPISFSTI